MRRTVYLQTHDAEDAGRRVRCATMAAKVHGCGRCDVMLTIVSDGEVTNE